MFNSGNKGFTKTSTEIRDKILDAQTKLFLLVEGKSHFPRENKVLMMKKDMTLDRIEALLAEVKTTIKLFFPLSSFIFCFI